MPYVFVFSYVLFWRSFLVPGARPIPYTLLCIGLFIFLLLNVHNWNVFFLKKSHFMLVVQQRLI